MHVIYLLYSHSVVCVSLNVNLFYLFINFISSLYLAHCCHFIPEHELLFCKKYSLFCFTSAFYRACSHSVVYNNLNTYILYLFFDFIFSLYLAHYCYFIPERQLIFIDFCFFAAHQLFIVHDICLLCRHSIGYENLNVGDMFFMIINFLNVFFLFSTLLSFCSCVVFLQLK